MSFFAAAPWSTILGGRGDKSSTQYSQKTYYRNEQKKIMPNFIEPFIIQKKS